jgi:hypothetical protein
MITRKKKSVSLREADGPSSVRPPACLLPEFLSLNKHRYVAAAAATPANQRPSVAARSNSQGACMTAVAALCDSLIDEGHNISHISLMQLPLLSLSLFLSRSLSLSFS